MYTNVFQRGDSLYVRGVKDGQRYNGKVHFSPTLWISNKAPTDAWRTLEGTHVETIQPGSINECKQFVETYKDVHGFDVYESPGNIYQYIAEEWPGEIQWSPNDIKVYTVDIETEVESGFPDPATAGERILLISVKDTRHNSVITWGAYEYNNTHNHVEYRVFSSEQSMLKDFISWWQHNCPDAVTGWNSSLFDVTYLYNRMCRVLGEQLAKKISPWGVVNQRDVDLGGRSAVKTYIMGVASLDYLDLYKKFTYSAQESYKLDYIAYVELGERKLENPTGTNSFKAFYSGEFEVSNKPADDAHEIEKKGYIRSQMKLEMQRRGLLPKKL